jgi:hypothetical protein
MNARYSEWMDGIGQTGTYENEKKDVQRRKPQPRSFSWQRHLSRIVFISIALVHSAVDQRRTTIKRVIRILEVCETALLRTYLDSQCLGLHHREVCFGNMFTMSHL